MKYRPAILTVCALALANCGGGGTSTVSGRSIQISWPARSRAVLTGPASALSVQITFKGAAPNGADIVFNENRNAEPAAYTGSYVVPDTIRESSNSLLATFYSQADEAGSVVATATASLSADQNPLSLANIALTGKVANVVVTPAAVTVGDSPTELSFTAKDEGGEVLALSPGSANWSVSQGTSNLNITADGMATGVAVGSPSVVATVDGIPSTPTAVTVSERVFTFPSGMGGTLVLPVTSAVEATLFKVIGPKDVSVTALGVSYFEENQPEMMTAIFDSSGKVLAALNIAPGEGTLSQGCYWRPITPITLKAGSEYYVGTLHSRDKWGPYIGNTNAATMPSYLQDLGWYRKVTQGIIDGNWFSVSQIIEGGFSNPHCYLANFQTAPIDN